MPSLARALLLVCWQLSANSFGPKIDTLSDSSSLPARFFSIPPLNPNLHVLNHRCLHADAHVWPHRCLAPKFWQKIGMEWLYRCLKEPRRLFKRYFVDDIQFFYYFAKQLIGIYKDPFRKK